MRREGGKNSFTEIGSLKHSNSGGGKGKEGKAKASAGEGSTDSFHRGLALLTSSCHGGFPVAAHNLCSLPLHSLHLLLSPLSSHPSCEYLSMLINEREFFQVISIHVITS